MQLGPENIHKDNRFSDDFSGVSLIFEDGCKLQDDIQRKRKTNINLTNER